MRNIKQKIMVAAAMLLAAGYSSAGVTVDFDSVVGDGHNPFWGYAYSHGPLFTQGFSFDAPEHPTGHLHLVDNTASCDSACLSDGSQYIGEETATMIMTKVGGGTFSVSSFDAANAYFYRNQAVTLTLHAEFAGAGTKTLVIPLTQNYFTTYHVVGFDNMTKLTFMGSDINGNPMPAGKPQGLWFAMDNINTTAVPEPETYGMMMAGLALVGMRARRRRA